VLSLFPAVDLSSDNDLARRTITKERELQIIQAALL
jgi:hypothetical protein